MKIRSIILSMVLVFGLSVPTYAKQTMGYSYNPNEETVFSPSNVAREKFNNPKGTWLSDGFLEISNPENGRIGIYAATFCHSPVDEIKTTIFIDQWDDETEDWKQVDYKSFTLTSENDGPLSEMILSFEVKGHEVNEWYRLRGLHVVYKGEDVEMFSTMTDSIEITKR